MDYYDVIRQILHFALFCMMSWMTSQILDNIFLKTTVFKVTKLLDPKHNNPV